MADNTTVLDAAQATVTIAADEIGGLKHQRVKVQYGPDGQATDVSTTAPLPVAVYPRQTLLKAVISTAASGSTSIVAVGTDTTKAIYVVNFSLVAAGAVSVKWQSGAIDLSGAYPLAANGGLEASGTIDEPLTWTAVNAALQLNLSAAVQVSGMLVYYKV